MGAMESRDFQFACTATLTAGEGRERLASRNFGAVDIAADWALATAGRQKDAQGTGPYGQVENTLGIAIEGRLIDDPDARITTVFSGTLAEAIEILPSRVRHFEAETIPKLRSNAEQRRRLKRTGLLRVAWFGVGIAVFVGLVFVVYRFVPPILDPERAAEEILARPPPAVAGRWALGQTTANCDSNYVEFKAGRYEAFVSGSRQQFAAAYSQPGNTTMRVEYAEGGIRLAQIFRLGPEPGRMSISGVESSVPEIEAAARRAIGTWLTKCPEMAK